jgi:Tol biopolymer transport system component
MSYSRRRITMVSRATSRGSLAAVLAVGAMVLVPVAAWTTSPSASPGTHPVLGPAEPWVAYQESAPARGGAHAVHLVRADGTGAFFAADAVPGGEQLHPDWSPDGRHIVLDVANAAGTLDLWILDTDDWTAERLVPCSAPCLWVSEPAWSRDGARIAYQRHVQVDIGEVSTVEIIDLASGDIEVVLDSGPEVGLYAPRWSPDGESLVVEMPSFSEEELLGVALGVLDLTVDPPALRTLVDGRLFANNPDWSPDGTSIVFSAPADGGEAGSRLSDLWLVDPSGGTPRRVTDLAAGGGTAVQPTFTADGSRIVFKLTDPSQGLSDEMASVALDGTDLRPAAGADYRFGWHPRLRPTR